MDADGQSHSDGVIATVISASFASEANGDRSASALAKEYHKREEMLLRQIEGSIGYYHRRLRRSKRAQRFITIAVMVGGTLAPVIVAGTVPDNGKSYFNIPTGWLSAIGVVLTIILAMLEGFRRIYRPEQQWTNCYNAKTTVYRARERYLLCQIGIEVGSCEWKDNLAELRATYESAIDKETNEFFASLRAPQSDEQSKGPNQNDGLGVQN